MIYSNRWAKQVKATTNSPEENVDFSSEKRTTKVCQCKLHVIKLNTYFYIDQFTSIDVTWQIYDIFARHDAVPNFKLFLF